MFGLASASQVSAQNAVVGWHAVMESSVAGSGRKNAVALPYYATSMWPCTTLSMRLTAVSNRLPYR